MAEAGLPDLILTARITVVAPTGTPSSIIERLNAAFRDVLTDETLRQRLQAAGAEPVGDTPAEAHAYLVAETARLGAVIRENNITLE